MVYPIKSQNDKIIFHMLYKTVTFCEVLLNPRQWRRGLVSLKQLTEISVKIIKDILKSILT